MQNEEHCAKSRSTVPESRSTVQSRGAPGKVAEQRADEMGLSRLVHRSAPDVARGFDDEAQLGQLLLLAEGVALDGGGEAALAGQAQLVE